MNKRISTTIRNLSKIKAIVFDLDGTLIYSAVDFIKLKRETIQLLMKLGIDTKDISEKMKTYEIMEQVRKQLGKLDISYETIADRVTKLWDMVELESADMAIMIPGTDAEIKSLRRQGLSIGIVTRSCHAYAVRVLKKIGLLAFIDIIVGRDDTPNAKPDPKPLLHAIQALHVNLAETVMVGDSLEDAECARLAGVQFIGILSGVLNSTNLKHDEKVIATIQELSEALGVNS